MKTILVSRTVRKYGEKRGFGTREVFREEEEMQPDGKVFKKVCLLFVSNDRDSKFEIAC